MSESFGDLVRRFRLAQSLTQEALAERAGVSPATIASLERGRRQARLSTVRELADALALTPQQRELLVAAVTSEALEDTAERPNVEQLEVAATPLVPAPAEPDGLEMAAAPGHGVAAARPPVPLTPLIGRHNESVSVADELLQERLVTLTGPGGVGKTRLALVVTAAVAGKFPGGLRWIDLAALHDAAGLTATVLAALGGTEAPTASGSEEGLLSAALAGPAPLLVFDGCEHLREAIGPLLARILSATNATVLATSRQPLNVEGEVCWQVPPLAVPDPDTVTGATLADNEAAGLFLERATRAEPTFTVDDETAVAVARICVRLDGIPLAIELAASRVRLFSTKQLVIELDNRFGLLAARTSGVPERHQTLLASVEWSYGLLDERERQVLQSLAAFPGAFTLAAAEAVAGAVAAHGGRPLERWDIVDALAQLVDKSMVIRQDVTRDPHYRLQETIRAFAEDRASEAGCLEAGRDAHAAYFHRWVEDLGGVDAGIDAVNVESDNVRAAWEWAAGRGLPMADTLAAALGQRAAERPATVRP